MPTPGAEAATAVDRFIDLAGELPGAQGVVYDTALRGVYHHRLMRDLGWVSVNRVAAAAGSRQQGNGKKRKRIEKTTYVETNGAGPINRDRYENSARAVVCNRCRDDLANRHPRLAELLGFSRRRIR